MTRQLKLVTRVALSIFTFAIIFGGDVNAHAQTVITNGTLQNGYDQVDCTKSSVDYLDDPSLTEAEKLARMDQALQRSLNKFDECAIAPKTEDKAKQAQAQQDKAAQGGNSGASSNMDKTSEASSGQNQGQSGTDNTQDKAQSGSWSNPNEVPEGKSATVPGQVGKVGSLPGSGLSGTEGGGQASSDATSEQAIQGGSLSSSDMSGTEPKPVQSSTLPGGGNSRENANQTGAQGVEQGGGYGKASGKSPHDKNLNNGKLPEDIPPADNDSVLEAQIRQAAINEKDPVIQKRLWNEYRKYKGLPTVE